MNDVSDDENLENALAADTSPGSEPCTWKQAMASLEAPKWKQAAVEEIDAMISNDTWEVDLPKGAAPISPGWVFKVKHNADGSIECYKARLVGKSCSQRPGIDYTEVFAPTF